VCNVVKVITACLFSLSNPMLLFAIGFCLTGWWFVSIKNQGHNVTLFGTCIAIVVYFYVLECVCYVAVCDFLTIT